MLTGKTVVLGVTGGIAAYKMPNVARMLKKMHCNVHVIMRRKASIRRNIGKLCGKRTCA